MAAAFPFSFIMFFSFLSFFLFFQFRFCFCFCFDFATLHPFLAFFFVRGVLGTVASEAVALSRERRGGRRRGKKGREGIKPNARKGEERDNREGGGTRKRGGNGDKTLGLGSGNVALRLLRFRPLSTVETPALFCQLLPGVADGCRRPAPCRRASCFAAFHRVRAKVLVRAGLRRCVVRLCE